MKAESSLTKVFTFNPSNQPIRVEVINNEPWFVAQDVTDILDIDRTQTRKLDEDEKGVRKIHTPGGPQEMTVITESGLYNMIFRSNKPEAKVFRKWVTSEVLPAIRKTGAYVSPFKYRPAGNREVVEDFTILAYRELLKIDSKPVRNRLAALIEFMGSRIKD